jgi:hypothetical protein
VGSQSGDKAASFVSDLSALEALHRALAEPYGIVIRTTNLALTRQNIYQLRKNSGDPDLDNLKVLASPYLPEEELWIVRKDALEKGGQSGAKGVGAD